MSDLYILVDNYIEKLHWIHQKCMIHHFDKDLEYKHHLIKKKVNSFSNLHKL
jgi:hypothetical protein